MMMPDVQKRTLVVAFLLFFLSCHVANSQYSAGLSYKLYKSIPAIDITGSKGNDDGSRLSDKVSLETVAYNIKTHLTPEENGEWRSNSTGTESWFLKIRSRGAYGLALVLSHVTLMDGEALYAYNHNGLQGPYAKKDIPRSGILPLDFLRGEEIMIEYNVPSGNRRHGSFVIETLSHAYRDIFKTDDHSTSGIVARSKDDGNCYNCLEGTGFDLEKRAVVKLVVHEDNSTRVCTGTLVNNTAGDFTPYILTAEHCVTNQFDADRTVFIFGYDDGLCGTTFTGDGRKLNGAFFRASLFENDFSLLELYAKPPLEFRPYYAGWDISDQYLDDVTCVHHPHGGPKRVSLSNGTVQTSDFNDGASRAPKAFWNVVQWDMGATEGGSSGAPLFNKKNCVIGTLSGGSSECGAPYNDYFERLSASWTPVASPDFQLKYWLDPLSSGVRSVAGTDPFEGIDPSCQTLSNNKEGEAQVLLPYTPGRGYFSGCNSDSIASYAERFIAPDSVMLTGAMLNVGSVNTDSPGGLFVGIQTGDQGLPGPVLLETYIPYYRLYDSLNYVSFFPYQKLKGEFFISYTVSYSPDDQFALRQASWRDNSVNTAFVKLLSGWTPLTSISPGGKTSSFGISITACTESVTETSPETTSITLYPNPSTTVLIGKLPDGASEDIELEVFDLQGKKQAVDYTIYESEIVITTNTLSPAMYIARISTVNKTYRVKFVKR